MSQNSGNALLERIPSVIQPGRTIFTESSTETPLPLINEDSFDETHGQLIHEILPTELLQKNQRKNDFPGLLAWDDHPTPALDILQSRQQDDRYLKMATAISLWLAVGLLWMPHFNFQPNSELVRMVKDPPKRRKVLRPPVSDPLTPTKLRQRQAKRLPVPDATPTIPEPLIHFDPMPELAITESTDWVIGIPEEVPTQVSPVVRSGSIGVEPPIITKRLPAIYPEKAKAVKVEGYVILEALLRRDGSIGELKILRSLAGGHWGFEEAAMTAVRAWEFTPGKYKGQPSDVLMTLKVDFRMAQ